MRPEVLLFSSSTIDLESLSVLSDFENKIPLAPRVFSLLRYVKRILHVFEIRVQIIIGDVVIQGFL